MGDDDALLQLMLSNQLPLMVGRAYTADRMNRDSLASFVDRMAAFGPVSDKTFEELAEDARVKAVMGEIGTNEVDRIDAEAAAAVESAIDAAVAAHKRAQWVYDGNWATLQGERSVFMQIHLREPERGPERATLEEFGAVVDELGRVWQRLHALTFLQGDFFSNSRSDLIAIARGEMSPPIEDTEPPVPPSAPAE